jgi:hypothetical protein
MTPPNNNIPSDLYAAFAAVVLIGLIAMGGDAPRAAPGERCGTGRWRHQLVRPDEFVSWNTHARIVAVPMGYSWSVPCIIDVSIIRAAGGSLIIEVMQTGHQLGIRVHWAGTRTSAGDADCSVTADLLLTTRDIGTLKFASGSLGIDVGEQIPRP